MSLANLGAKIVQYIILLAFFAAYLYCSSFLSEIGFSEDIFSYIILSLILIWTLIAKKDRLPKEGKTLFIIQITSLMIYCSFAVVNDYFIDNFERTFFVKALVFAPALFYMLYKANTGGSNEAES
ncbi:hypothetical protein PVT68_18210 [Microbulbifer bruguierae]|uniref:Uncharacterized protein n=1 Tax=Microbulbifer bruguierae TaxID=3029061 RepID=A0ABY8NF15_9GAMM|nr:hypothetical protein [Microbulbifer bruguierae]WGL16672.1 hypothetical protein PVT68_18210 [Microbulbifer bruguierae]